MPCNRPLPTRLPRPAPRGYEHGRGPEIVPPLAGVAMIGMHAGRVVDRYRVEGILGHGAMAAVYRVRHVTLGTLHALKVLQTNNPDVQARLLQEGRTQGSLRHPNVCAVTDVIDVGGSPALVLEYVHGPSLDRMIGRLPLAQIDEVARGILSGMAAAHAIGVVHRDLKPANILLQVDEGRLVAKVADFGVARILDPDPGMRRTRSGLAVGSPAYMAPEQIRDASRVDARADIFALGAVLYELVTGDAAFMGRDIYETFRNVSEGRFEPPARLVRDLPPRMDRAIRWALQLDREARPPDCATLLAEWSEGVELSTSEPLPEGLLREAVGLIPTFEALPPAAAATAPVAPAAVSVLPPNPPRLGRGHWVLASLAAVAMGFAAGSAAWFARHDEPNAAEAGVVSPDPRVQAQYVRAWEAFLDADFRAARLALDDVIALAPGSALPLLLASEVDEGLGMTDRSSDELRRAWDAVDPADPSQVARLVRLCHDTGTLGHEAVQARWQTFLAEFPRDYLAHYMWANGGVAGWQDEVEIAGWNTVISLNPLAPVGYVRKAATLDGQLRVEESLASLNEALRLAPASTEVRAWLGRAHFRLGRWAEARDAWAVAIARDPGRVALRLDLARAYDKLGDVEAATRNVDAVFSSETSLEERVDLAPTWAMHTAEEGRLREARGVLDRCDAWAREVGPARVASCARARVALDVNLRDLDALQADVPAWRTAVADPEFAAGPHAYQAAEQRFAEGKLAYFRGDREALAAVIGQAPGGSPDPWVAMSMHGLLDLQSRLDGDLGPQLEALAAIRPRTCRVAYETGELLLAHGQNARAEAAFAECPAAATTAPRSDWTGLFQAAALVALAELEAAAAPELAREHLAAFRAGWPRADSDHPLVLRAEAAALAADR